MAVQLIRHLLTASDYHLMREVGILTEDDKVELINGEIIQMSPKGSKHAGFIGKLSEILFLQIQIKAHLRLQDPIRLGNLSEPEPDIAIVRRKEDFYTSAHPQPSDVFFLIEVADTSLIMDREVKLPLFASHNVPEVWIINIIDEEIEIHRAPQGDIYTIRHIIKKGNIAEFQALDIQINPEQLFG